MTRRGADRSPAVRQVDARGTLCPVPTALAALALADLKRGEVLDLWADDPATRSDFPAWCREFGHAVESITEDPPAFHIRIRR